MKDLQLIHELCESRIFRSKQDTNKYTARQKQDLYYAVLLSTIALALDTKTKTWAQSFASSAAAFANFDFFRVSANDLYVLTYIVQNELKLIGKPQKQGLLRLYKGIGRGVVDKSFVMQTLLRMERTLNITDSRLRTARRTITNWGDATPAARKTALTQLHRFIHIRAKLAEVLPYIKVLLKGEPGRFGKSSPLKTAAALAGAGLAGLALGLRHDPNKRWSVFDDARPTETPINEDRPTQLFQLVQDMRKHPEVEKIVSVNYLTDGISAFVRTTDGNAYEMEIRPARFAKGHEEKRGVNEGWDWMILGEGYEKCDNCDGSGFAPSPGFTTHCRPCKGTGEVYNWTDEDRAREAEIDRLDAKDDFMYANPFESINESIDMTDETCEACQQGQYKETSIFDDMDGVLHCDNCGTKIDRYAEANDQVWIDNEDGEDTVSGIPILNLDDEIS